MESLLTTRNIALAITTGIFIILWVLVIRNLPTEQQQVDEKDILIYEATHA